MIFIFCWIIPLYSHGEVLSRAYYNLYITVICVNVAVCQCVKLQPRSWEHASTFMRQWNPENCRRLVTDVKGETRQSSERTRKTNKTSFTTKHTKKNLCKRKTSYIESKSLHSTRDGAERPNRPHGSNVRCVKPNRERAKRQMEEICFKRKWKKQRNKGKRIKESFVPFLCIFFVIKATVCNIQKWNIFSITMCSDMSEI